MKLKRQVICVLVDLSTSDNANLLDIKENTKAGRFVCYFLAKSAAVG